MKMADKITTVISNFGSFGAEPNNSNIFGDKARTIEEIKRLTKN